MKNRPELDLLIDLAKLIKKHGPECFETLADYARSPDFARRLADLLSASATVARTTRTERTESTKREPANSLGNTLAVLQQTEPQKYELISDFYNALQKKAVLPTMRDIKAFVLDCGLPEIRGNSRQEAIVPLIKKLMLLPTATLSVKLRIPKTNEKGDRSLEGWTSIILDKGRRAE
ncbi:MAG: hypothetical protein Q7T57_09335 [Dehalococcoidales bacterium]|nr:hypothetical protein [Dehalococcoidales bacterium]